MKKITVVCIDLLLSNIMSGALLVPVILLTKGSITATLIAGIISSILFPVIFREMSRNTKRKKIPIQSKIHIQEFVLYALLTVTGTFLISYINSSFLSFIKEVFVHKEYTSVLSEYESAPILLMLVIVVIIAPITEEYIFRKYLLEILNEYEVSQAILIDGLLFGMFHFNFEQFPYALFGGIILATVMMRYGRIQYCIALHMIMNLFGTIIPNLGFNDSILIVVSIVGCVYILIKYRKKLFYSFKSIHWNSIKRELYCKGFIVFTIFFLIAGISSL